MLNQESVSEIQNHLPIHIILLQIARKEISPEEGIGNLNALKKLSNFGINQRFPEGTYLGGQLPLSSLFISGCLDVNNKENVPHLAGIIFDELLPIIKDNLTLSKQDKRNIYTEALYTAVINHNMQEDYNCDFRKYINTLLTLGADYNRCTSDTKIRIADIAKRKGLVDVLNLQWTDDANNNKEIISNVLEKNVCGSLLPKKYNYILAEDLYAVVSLIRNPKSSYSQHVFILIERIIKGESVVHFVDFTHFRNEPHTGSVKKRQSNGRLGDKELLKICHEDLLLRIDNPNDLKFQSWQITDNACEDLLKSIETDVKIKSHDYGVLGNQSFVNKLSFFGSTSSPKGHNCYTWARDTLRKINDPRINKDLKPTFEEWIAAIPSVKDNWQLFRNTLFTVIAVSAIGFIGFKFNNTPNSLITINLTPSLPDVPNPMPLGFIAKW